jgi:hypothetical protein
LGSAADSIKRGHAELYQPNKKPRGLILRAEVRLQFPVVGAGFEPAYDFRRTVLQTVAINHSATPPGESLGILGHSGIRARCTSILASFGPLRGFFSHVFPDIADRPGDL